MRLQRARTVRLEFRAGGDVVESPCTGASLKIIATPTATSRSLEVERTFKNGMKRAREHVHLDFAETFTIKKGIAEARLGGDTLRLSAGKMLHVPRGVPHVNPYVVDSDELTLRQSFDPPTDGACSYIQTLERVLWEGRDHYGELPAEVILAIGDVTDERTYFTETRTGWWTDTASFALQRKLLLPAGRLLAGLAGHAVYLTYEPVPTHEEIAERAYDIHTREDGDARENWFRAKRELEAD